MARLDRRWRSQSPYLTARNKPIVISAMSIVRCPESCQGLLFPIALICSLNRSSMRELDASSMNSLNEVCDTSSWKVEMLLRTFFQMAKLCSVVDIYPQQNPFQAASLNIASYMIL